MFQPTTAKIDSSELAVSYPSVGICLIALARPERRNALSTKLLIAVAAALTAAGIDKNIRVVIVTGGPDCFAAGADINELDQADADEPIDSPRFRAWGTIRSFSKPLIAAVEGWCLGAGLELAMTADYIIAGEGARFGQPEINVGIIPGGGGTALLPRLVGRSVATRMILTGEPISAQAALANGLVGEVTPSTAAIEAAMALAESLAKRAPLALYAAKASLRDADVLPIDEHFVAERRRFIELLSTADKKEGMAAFQEKRPARWCGR